ncbi:hypothetical protein [Collimonas arenae]|uniref:hypothetical protein n=1 Tax=Collimonas arenae TaxID=279058 RepID=UPI0012E92166|nr:hypothetical protein [Collimonas arenae]
MPGNSFASGVVAGAAGFVAVAIACVLIVFAFSSWAGRLENSFSVHAWQTGYFYGD